MTPLDIIHRVAVYRGVSLADLLGPRHHRAHAWPRHEAMWVIRKKTLLSLPLIGALFHGRDHTTVLYGVRRVQATVDQDPAYGARLLALTDRSDADVSAGTLQDMTLLLGRKAAVESAILEARVKARVA